MYESNFSVAVLPSNVMPPPLPPSPSYTMPPPPPPLHIEMPQLWQEKQTGIFSVGVFFPMVTSFYFYCGFRNQHFGGSLLRSEKNDSCLRGFVDGSSPENITMGS